MTDKEAFITDWQKIILTQPNLFSPAAKRYIRARIAKMTTECEPNFKVNDFGLELLKLLSEEPSKSFLARDLAPRMHFISNTTTLTGVAGSIGATLSQLIRTGYVRGDNLKPQSYQITVKGLKFLNKLIGNYD